MPQTGAVRSVRCTRFVRGDHEAPGAIAKTRQITSPILHETPKPEGIFISCEIYRGFCGLSAIVTYKRQDILEALPMMGGRFIVEFLVLALSWSPALDLVQCAGGANNC